MYLKSSIVCRRILYSLVLGRWSVYAFVTRVFVRVRAWTAVPPCSLQSTCVCVCVCVGSDEIQQLHAKKNFVAFSPQANYTD
jgi:hypothetical protein